MKYERGGDQREGGVGGGGGEKRGTKARKTGKNEKREAMKTDGRSIKLRKGMGRTRRS